MLVVLSIYYILHTPFYEKHCLSFNFLLLGIFRCVKSFILLILCFFDINIEIMLCKVFWDTLEVGLWVDTLVVIEEHQNATRLEVLIFAFVTARVENYGLFKVVFQFENRIFIVLFSF